MTPPKLIILAGPNGSGKSTLADVLKKNGQIKTFLNADTIANGLGNSVKSEIESGRVLIKVIRNLLDAKQDIAFETTLSGKIWIKLIKDARTLGYHIEIYFIFVESVDLAIQRVANRVKEGGHNIPGDTILRRFPRSLNNFRSIYQKLVDNWWLFNNTNNSAIIIAAKPNGKEIVFDQIKYNLFQEL